MIYTNLHSPRTSQALSTAIKAAPDLASLREVLCAHIGHPLLDPLHIALALTQVWGESVCVSLLAVSLFKDSL